MLNTNGSNGYYWIVAWSTSLSDGQIYFDTNGYTPTDYYQRQTGAGQALILYSTAYYTGSTGIPQHALIDRDGNVRKYSVGQMDYTPTRAQEWRDDVSSLM